MQIIIDIPDFKWLENEGDFKEAVKEYEQGTRFDKEIRKALINGKPLQKGRWINLEKTKYKGQLLPFWCRYECSVCSGYGELNFEFCPNCGAKLEV
jgi:hypothetical protein